MQGKSKKERVFCCDCDYYRPGFRDSIQCVSRKMSVQVDEPRSNCKKNNKKFNCPGFEYSLNRIIDNFGEKK